MAGAAGGVNWTAFGWWGPYEQGRPWRGRKPERRCQQKLKKMSEFSNPRPPVPGHTWHPRKGLHIPTSTPSAPCIPLGCVLSASPCTQRPPAVSKAILWKRCRLVMLREWRHLGWGTIRDTSYVLSHSVMSDSSRLLCPWDSPGKNTGVGCHFLL